MNIGIKAFFLLFSFYSLTGAAKPTQRVVELSITSQYVKNMPVVKVILPPSYITEAQSKKAETLTSTQPRSDKTNKRYPVIYLLDGEANYALVSSMLERMALSNGAQEYIIVSLESQNRLYDFAPTVNMDRRGPYGQGGGGEKFLDFIEKELITVMRNHYQASDFSAIMGHSVGGLLVFHAFYSRPSLFNGHMAFSPAVWWGEQETMTQVKKYVYSSEDIGSYLYTNIGNEAGMMREHYDSLVNTLQRNRTSELVLQSEHYPHDSHGLTFSAGLYSALKGMDNYQRKLGL